MMLNYRPMLPYRHYYTKKTTASNNCLREIFKKTLLALTVIIRNS